MALHPCATEGCRCNATGIYRFCKPCRHRLNERGLCGQCIPASKYTITRQAIEVTVARPRAGRHFRAPAGLWRGKNALEAV